jgi:hypothetical protein
MISTYVAFLLISVAPILVESTLPPSGSGDTMKDRSWLSAVYLFTHAYIINPFITFLAVAALFPQVRELQSSPDLGAISVTGLVMQAFTFAIVAVGWSLRLQLPLSEFRQRDWYPLVGWATVDNLVFAVVQGMLWWIARRRLGLSQIVESGEAAPLLA